MKKQKHHAYNMTGSEGHQVILIKGGNRAYLWANNNKESTGVHFSPCVFSGAKRLRKLAYAILREVPSGKPRPTTEQGKEEKK
jgi:hypothetical protein